MKMNKNEIIIEEQQMSPMYRMSIRGMNDVLNTLYHTTNRYEAIAQNGYLDQGWSLSQPGNIPDLLTLFIADVKEMEQEINSDMIEIPQSRKEYLLSLCTDFCESADFFLNEAEKVKNQIDNQIEGQVSLEDMEII